MEIINWFFSYSVFVFLYWLYVLLSGEFRQDSYELYFGNLGEIWDFVVVFNEVMFIYFFDFLFLKFWLFVDFGLQRFYELLCVNE